jgi:hypothetical protein
VFGVEGLEDALGRLQDKLPRMSLTWDDEVWTVELVDEDGTAYSGQADDLLDAYDEAWGDLKEES